MGFFRRGEDEDVEPAEAPARIEDGGIPSAAEARLKVLATEGSLFTSGLSVNEFALLEMLGPEPLAQVMGASVVRTGRQYLPALEPGAAQIVYSGYARGGGMVVTTNRWGNRYGEASPSQVRQYRRHTEVCASWTR